MALRIDDLTLATSSASTDEIEFSLTGAAGSRKMRMIDLRSMLLTAFGGVSNATDYLTLGASPPATGKVRLDVGTVTTDSPGFNSVATWNAGGVTFTHIRVNITNTASAAASMFADFQVATVSQWKVTRAGIVTQTGALNTGDGITVTTNNNTFLKLSHNGSNTSAFIWLNAWNTVNKNWQIDTGAIGANFCITPSTANGGFTFTTPVFTLTSAGVATITGGLTVSAGTTAVQALTATAITASSEIRVSAGNVIGTTGRGGWESPADGKITLFNEARSGFTLLQLGGTGATKPAVGINGVNIELRLADNSAGTGIIATSGTFTGTVNCTVADANSGAFTNNSTTGNPAIQFWNKATSSDNVFANFYTEGGAGTLRGSIDFNRAGVAVRYNTTSDERLKKNLGVASSTKILLDLIVRNFEWTETEHKAIGLFAQEAFKVKPDAVRVGSTIDDPWGVDYSKFVPDLIVGWKDHEARLSKLESLIQ